MKCLECSRELAPNSRNGGRPRKFCDANCRAKHHRKGKRFSLVADEPRKSSVQPTSGGMVPKELREAVVGEIMRRIGEKKATSADLATLRQIALDLESGNPPEEVDEYDRFMADISGG